jgi:hypothetical protein
MLLLNALTPCSALKLVVFNDLQDRLCTYNITLVAVEKQLSIVYFCLCVCVRARGRACVV